MNQILVTQKIYVTPELRRRKKMYKIQFIICAILACMLFSYYVYAEFDRARSEEVSQQILANLGDWQGRSEQESNRQTNRNDSNNRVDTTIKKDNIIVVALDDDEEEIEEVLQVASTSQTVTASGIDYTVDAKLTIPSLDISYPVISGSSESEAASEELLKISLNYYWGPKPNTVGNYCVVGHNYKNGSMFGMLSQIVSGDIIELEDASGKTINYAVYDKYTVEPTDTSCTSQLTNGRKEVTLITCAEYGTRRLVVKAREVI